jgi:pyruvate dehydrogenase E1 component alpha subunit
MCGCEIRSDEEIAELKKQDPIVICHKKLMARKILTKKTIEKIDAEVAAELEAAENFADESSPPEPSIFDDLLYAN